MNSENSKTSNPHRLLLFLTNEIDLKRGEKSVAMSNLSIYYTWKNIKSSYKNNEFKIFAPVWNNKFECQADHILNQVEDYFEYITKKNETFANNSAIKIYIKKMENRITFKMKTAYYL